MNSNTETILLCCEESNVRLDRFLAENSCLTRSRVVQLIESENVFVNGFVRAKNFKLSKGDQITYALPPDEEIDAVPQDIPLDIYYEDEHILVVNKPQGMCVHPAAGNPDKTLVNALLHHCKDSLSGINGKLRPGIVHRIDKDTSGLLIVAKSDAAHNLLGEMFQNHSFVRKYEAIVYGSPKSDEGTIELAIGRSKKDRKKMAFYPLNTPNTKNAVTHYRVIQRFRSHTHIELNLETGRTHQIRVHMLSMSCPVLADPIYAPGRENFGLSGQCLHAKYISFRHPISREEMTFESPLPPYFQDVLDKLKKRDGIDYE